MPAWTDELTDASDVVAMDTPGQPQSKEELKEALTKAEEKWQTAAQEKAEGKATEEKATEALKSSRSKFDDAIEKEKYEQSLLDEARKKERERNDELLREAALPVGEPEVTMSEAGVKDKIKADDLAVQLSAEKVKEEDTGPSAAFLNAKHKFETFEEQISRNATRAAQSEQENQRVSEVKAKQAEAEQLNAEYRKAALYWLKAQQEKKKKKTREKKIPTFPQNT